MSFSKRPAITALSLVLGLAQGSAAVAATAPRPSLLSAAQALESQRVQQARDYVRAHAAQLGLTSLDDVKLLSVLTNPQGEAVVRFAQQYQGSSVHGTTVVVRVGKQVQVTAQSLESRIQLPPAGPRLTADQALERAHRDLTPTGEYSVQPTVERIVFPARLVGGVEPKVDPDTGAVTPDPLRSVAVGTVSARHVWAWHVRRELVSSSGDSLVLHAIVDGDSGLLLRKWSEGEAQDALTDGTVLPPPVDYLAQAARQQMPIRVRTPVLPASALAPAASAVPIPDTLTPAVGTVNTYYLGQRQIPTSFDAATNGYGLHDITRGVGPSAFLGARGLPPGNRIITEELLRSVVAPDGKVTAYYRDYTMASGPSSKKEDTGTRDNVWGDGQDWVQTRFGLSPFTTTGKTAAGEAMFAVTTVYDVLNNVFHRKSYDGNDTAIVVQANVQYMSGKTQWSPVKGYFISGMGNPSNWGTTSGPISTHNGAELTSIAHELGLALHQSVVPEGELTEVETFQLERSSGALLAQLAAAYAQRQSSDPADLIPVAPIDWTFGKTRTDGRPFFWMNKPSKDGFSPDAWFDGIWMLGQKYYDGISYGDGPMNRAWYFMAEGASSDSGSDAYSPFLPQGMQGMGLQKVGQVFFKALTERYLASTGYAEAREACIAAAVDLFGAGSPEVVAVTNAFAAVNVGAPYGEPARVKVAFPDHLIEEGSPGAPYRPYMRFQVVPNGVPVKLQINVQNATNTAVQWKAEGVPGIMTSTGGATPQQGTFDAQGRYRSPMKGNYAWNVQAWSAEDPRQFAQGVVLGLEMDCNGDGEVDALDMADIAMLTYMPSSLKDLLNPYALFGPRSSISDWDVQIVTLGFNNAFNR